MIEFHLSRTSILALLTVMLFAATWPALVLAEDSPEEAQSKLRATEIQNSMSELKALRIENAKLKQRVVVLEKELKEATDWIARHEAKDVAPTPPVPPKSFEGPLKIGCSGKPEFLRVVQIMGPSEMLVSIIYYESDGSNTMRAAESIVWSKGISTEGLADKSEVRCPPGGIRVTGTHQYNSTSGAAKTVFVVEPCELNPEQNKSKQANQPTSARP